MVDRLTSRIRRAGRGDLQSIEWIVLVAVAAGVFWNESALAQVTVQLPQYRQFQVNGSVMVPDGGSTFSGGSSRSAMGSRQYGALPFRPFANRVSGGESAAVATSTSVQVYSLREMEARVMGSLSPDYLATLTQSNSDAALRAQQQVAADRAKFRELGQKNAHQKVERAKEDVRWARKFAAEGNHLAADMFYEQAIESLPPDLAELAEKEHRSYRASRR